MVCFYPGKVLARHSIQAKMSPIIRRSHDGIWACVRRDCGETSEWFRVNEDVDQGCVLSLRLLSIFLGMMLTMTFDRFLINEVVAKSFIGVAERGGKTRNMHAIR